MKVLTSVALTRSRGDEVISGGTFIKTFLRHIFHYEGESWTME